MALSVSQRARDFPYECPVVPDAGCVHGAPQESLMYGLLTLQLRGDKLSLVYYFFFSGSVLFLTQVPLDILR